jgi:hypothetical protein
VFKEFEKGIDINRFSMGKSSLAIYIHKISSSLSFLFTLSLVSNNRLKGLRAQQRRNLAHTTLYQTQWRHSPWLLTFILKKSSVGGTNRHKTFTA